MSRIQLVFAVLLATGIGNPAWAAATEKESESQRIQALEQSVALVLANDGFEAFSKLFHPEWTNWSNQQELVQREPYLAAVKRWYEAGNHAVAVDYESVSLDIIGDVAISSSRMREEFNDGTAFLGRFVTVLRKVDDRWLLYRTNFITDHRGPSADVPAL